MFKVGSIIEDNSHHSFIGAGETKIVTSISKCGDFLRWDDFDSGWDKSCFRLVKATWEDL